MFTNTHADQNTLEKIKSLTIIAIVLALLAIWFGDVQRPPLATAETQFVETSAHGMGITPASCASSPVYYHYHLFAGLNGNVRGFVVYPGNLEHGATLSGISTYICISNCSANSIFVPANTAAEVNAFKAATIPSVSKW